MKASEIIVKSKWKQICKNKENTTWYFMVSFCGENWLKPNVGFIVKFCSKWITFTNKYLLVKPQNDMYILTISMIEYFEFGMEIEKKTIRWWKIRTKKIWIFSISDHFFIFWKTSIYIYPLSIYFQGRTAKSVLDKTKCQTSNLLFCGSNFSNILCRVMVIVPKIHNEYCYMKQ